MKRIALACLTLATLMNVALYAEPIALIEVTFTQPTLNNLYNKNMSIPDAQTKREWMYNLLEYCIPGIMDVLRKHDAQLHEADKLYGIYNSTLSTHISDCTFILSVRNDFCLDDFKKDCSNLKTTWIDAEHKAVANVAYKPSILDVTGCCIS